MALFACCRLPQSFRGADVRTRTNASRKTTIFCEVCHFFPARRFSVQQRGIVLVPIGDEINNSGNSLHVCSRRPSSTLVVLVITQLQFIATLSLVDSVARNSFLADFVAGLRYTCVLQLDFWHLRRPWLIPCLYAGRLCLVACHNLMGA